MELENLKLILETIQSTSEGAMWIFVVYILTSFIAKLAAMATGIYIVYLILGAVVNFTRATTGAEKDNVFAQDREIAAILATKKPPVI